MPEQNSLAMSLFIQTSALMVKFTQNSIIANRRTPSVIPWSSFQFTGLTCVKICLPTIDAAFYMIWHLTSSLIYIREFLACQTEDGWLQTKWLRSKSLVFLTWFCCSSFTDSCRLDQSHYWMKQNGRLRAGLLVECKDSCFQVSGPWEG